MPSRLLHVGNGHATTGLIELSAIPGRTMVWCDPLDEGPVPGGISDDELLRIRAGFLSPTPHEIDDIAAGLQGWRSAVDNQDAYDELVLWFEHDLFDQLNLLQLLTHLGRSVPRTTPVTLISIDRYPGHPNFKGLGELEPDELATLFSTRQPVSDFQFALAPRAWQAFRSPDPRDIEALLRTDTSALPFLAAALRRHLQELPAVENGLSRTERRLLERVGDGTTELRQIFPGMQDGETAYYVTDTSLWDRVQLLASTSPALLDITGVTSPTNALPAATIALTPVGHAVLSGTADRVRLCGIDRWFGGVHAKGSGPVWRWSERDGRVIMA